MTEDRDKWWKYVHGVANPRIEDGQRTEQIRTIKFPPNFLTWLGDKKVFQHEWNLCYIDFKGLLLGHSSQQNKLGKYCQ